MFGFKFVTMKLIAKRVFHLPVSAVKTYTILGSNGFPNNKLSRRFPANLMFSILTI